MKNTPINAFFIRALVSNRESLMDGIRRNREHAAKYPLSRSRYVQARHALTGQLIIADCDLCVYPHIRKQVRELASQLYRENAARRAARAAQAERRAA